MKRRTLFIITLISMVFAASCGKDDMEFLRHPYHVQGEIDPTYAIPAASGKVNLNELLSMFDGTFSAFITDDNVITFHYDTSITETIRFGNVVKTRYPKTSKQQHTARSAKGATKEYAAPFITRDTVISYTLPIDLFDKANLQTVVNADISINQLMLTLHANVKAGCTPELETKLNKYVDAVFDNVTIKYIPHDGDETDEQTFTGFAQQKLRLDSIINGGHIEFDSVNLADIVNAMPRQISASFHLHIEVDSSIVEDELVNAIADTGSITTFNALLDSLRMSWLTFGADLSVDIPLEIHIGSLPFTYHMPINLGQQQSDGETLFDKIRKTLDSMFGEGVVNIDPSSKVSVILRMNNGLPLHIKMDVTMVDSNDVTLVELLRDGDIAQAITATDATTGADTVTAAKTSTLEIPLNIEEAERLLKTKEMVLTMTLMTDGPSSRKMAVRRTDMLGIDILVKLNPKVSFDKPML